MTMHLVVKTPTSCVPLSHFPKNQWSLNITSQPSTCETAKKKKKKAKTTNREEFLKNLRAVGLAGKTPFFCFYFQFLVGLITKKN